MTNTEVHDMLVFAFSDDVDAKYVDITLINGQKIPIEPNSYTLYETCIKVSVDPRWTQSEIKPEYHHTHIATGDTQFLIPYDKIVYLSF